MPETRIVTLDVHGGRPGHVRSGWLSPPEPDELSRVLLYSVSHDVRTPLTAIRTIAAALRSGDLDSERREAMLAEVDQQAERLSRLLSNLLEASRIEADAVRPALTGVPVDELCRGAIDDARAVLGGRFVEIQIEPGLPSVEIDETMIRQALVNLLENAARYDQGPLAVRAARAGGYLEIRVIDHGPGVPVSEQLCIFEAFRGRRRHARGAGLGLTIVRGFVEAHGGDVHVEATEGDGATFVVSLPLVDGDREPVGPGTRAQAGSLAAG
jgi:two-component system sensor histidine kinase KdpD